ncbi:MAG: hypothetical protein KF796_19580 [Ramlibacter sp.]|nr:hypothetical protein [Ramlibacter sp.]
MTAARALALLVAVIALVTGGYQWGARATNNAWQAKQAERNAQAQADYQAEALRADQATTLYLTEHRDQEERYEQLQDRFKDLRARNGLYSAPRVVPPVAAADAAPAADATAPGCLVIQVAEPDEPPPFNLGAIRMWNSALAGRDVPAGACGAAAAASGTEAACAESSGLYADDAWDNHEANAKSCAEDRARYRHLIEFLKGKKTNAQQQ